MCVETIKASVSLVAVGVILAQTHLLLLSCLLSYVSVRGHLVHPLDHTEKTEPLVHQVKTAENIHGNIFSTSSSRIKHKKEKINPTN